MSNAELLRRLNDSGRATEGGCFVWTKCLSPAGYGNVRINQKTRLVHRLIWTLVKGEIPKGLCVCHRCDNPACFKIDHLFLGTHQENMEDMARKGRAAYVPGELCGKAKLTTEQILLIRNRYASGEMQKDIAKDFGVHPAHVSRVISGKRWAHLTKGLL